MKRRNRHANALAAAVIASLALLPLYGDPRPSPVTHPDWARMVLRGLDLLDSTPLSAQASQIFATLSWKNSLAYRADRYLTAEGVQVEGTGEVRRVLARAEVGEVAYPIAVARGGDYRVRLLLSGDPAFPAEAEIRALGQDKPEKVFTVPGHATPAWADAGTVHLDPGAYSATVLLPKGTDPRVRRAGSALSQPHRAHRRMEGDGARHHRRRGGDGAEGARPRVRAAAVRHRHRGGGGGHQGRGPPGPGCELRARARPRGGVAEGRTQGHRRLGVPRPSRERALRGLRVRGGGRRPALHRRCLPQVGDLPGAGRRRPARGGGRCSPASSRRAATS